MDERMDIIRALNTKIEYIVEDYLVETFDLIQDYINKYSFREDSLSMLDAGETKRIISRYFRGITNNFIPELQYYLQSQARTVENHLSKKNEIVEIDRFLSDYNFESFLSNQLRVQINAGLREFTEEFKSDFKNECLSSFPLRAREDIRFDEIISEFRRNLFNKIEELMDSYRKYITRICVNRFNDSMKDYKDSALKEIKEKEIENKKQVSNRFKYFIDSIYDSNKELIESNFDLNAAYQNLVNYYTELENQGVDFSKLSYDQIIKFNKLAKTLIDLGKEIAIREQKKAEQTEQEKIDEALSKIKSQNDSNKSKELPQDKKELKEESKNDDLSLIDVSEIDYDAERKRIENAKHLTDKDKQIMLEELDIQTGRKTL
mgnify:CR=1 FL=1